ncbi:MAG: uracil-DNA glycosylase family protein [Bacteroidales bacterium]|nr:uracil-DNA glycosylase family protein [Bacteroidales bacterium]
MDPGIERHPFEPFLPGNAKVLFLGSFPPQPKRWSVEFYYPNFINDFWRIMGIVFHGDKDRFVDTDARKFKLLEIKSFCEEKGIALFDTATAVRRLKDNASDKFLEVVEPTDIASLLERIPGCGAVVTTGQKATETLCGLFGAEEPPMGGHIHVNLEGRELDFYRLPSTSRAYPLPLQRKADAYRRLFEDLGTLPADSR